MLKYPFEEVPAPAELSEVAPGVHWLRMPLPMALDHINLYLLEDHDGWWVVDTGIAIGATEAHWERIFADRLQGKPVKAVIATHYHPDHIGMAGWICEKWRVPFYMTQAEYLSGLTFSRLRKEHFSWESEQFLHRSGYSAEQVAAARERAQGFGGFIKPMPTAYRRLADGDVLTINGKRWRILVGRGHSPEHACLYSGALNVLLSGDQVIPRITSNISVSAGEPEANPLRDWFNSLEHFLDRLPSGTLVLPAHNVPFYGLHERLRFLIEHHEEHLLALEQACLEGSPIAMELLPVLFKRELDRDHVGLALGECVAHLNFLLHRGQISRSLDEDGRYRYQSVDETLPLRLRKHKYQADSSDPIQV